MAQAISAPGQLQLDLTRKGSLVWFLTHARLNLWTRGRALGAWWWLLEPLAMTFVYVVMVQFVFRAGIEHFPLFLMCAILPWTWFLTSTTSAMESFRSNDTVIKSLPVDHTIFPASEILACTVRFLLALVILAGLMMVYQVPINHNLIWLPYLLIVQFLLTLGIGFWLALAQVYTMDVSNSWTVLSRFWFYASPSLYPLAMVPDSIRTVYLLNPFATLFPAYRAVLMHGQRPDLLAITLVGIIGVALTLTGHAAIRRQEGKLALFL